MAASSNIYGWLVPIYSSCPQMTVKPLSLLDGKVFSAGREPRSCLVLKDWMFQGDSTYRVDNTSRLHFEIFRQEKKTFIVDKSGNGTFVQGRKLTKDEPKVLYHGDSIGLLCQDMELFTYVEENERTFPLQVIVGKALGAGSYGVAYRGWQVVGDLKEVAVKIIHKNSFNNTLIPELKNEINILKTLEHPGVIRLEDVHEDEDHLGIVMEYAEGGELERQLLLDRTLGKLSEKTAKLQVSH